MFENMENFTAAVNETTTAVDEWEATTALGQSMREWTTTERVKSFAKLVNDIHLYGFIILIPLGIIFNSLSLIIFQKNQAFSTAIGNHLKCISISDSIMLIGGFLGTGDEYWEEKINFSYIQSLSNFSCKITMYVLNIGILSSGLIMSSATIERFLAISFPLKYRSWNTLRTSRIVLSLFLIISFGISTYTLFLLKISEKGECDIIEKHIKTYDLMFTIFPMLIANGICGCLILILTLIIIVLLFHQLRKRNVLSSNSENLSSKKEVRISAMLVTISLLFIFLRFPKILVVKFVLVKLGDPLLIKAMSKLTEFLTALNHSINIIIYVIFLEQFRKTFFEMFSWFFVKLRQCPAIFKKENSDEG